MPKRKKPNNSHFPVGLTRIVKRGKQRFRFRKIDQSEILFPSETKELEAIEAAAIYNARFRNSTINLLVSNKSNQVLSHWLSKVADRVFSEEFQQEKISAEVFQTFKLDLERLNQSHGSLLTTKISLQTVNEYLDQHHAGTTANVYNAKLAFLSKVFDYLMDEGVIETNFAKQKKKKPKPKRNRSRLNLPALCKLVDKADLYLSIAMRLSYQTTHAVNEISKIKYSHCKWLDQPMIQNNLKIFGYLYIHRQKVKNNEASRVAIPITEMIKKIIDDSRLDGVNSPFIVHRKKQRKTSKLAKGLEHQTQVRNADISEGFSKLRDELGLFADFEKKKRPSYHEIRSLAIHQYDKIGVDPQKRAAHSDPNTTKKYKEGHTKWVQVEPAQLEI